MINKIRTDKQYAQVMETIEAYLKKATNGGGFNSLSNADDNELKQLSILAEIYEDDVLQIMPLAFLKQYMKK